MATCLVLNNLQFTVTVNTANTTVNGSKAVSTAGSDELASMKLDGSDFNGGTASQSIALLPRAGGATATPSTAGEANPLQWLLLVWLVS